MNFLRGKSGYDECKCNTEFCPLSIHCYSKIKTQLKLVYDRSGDSNSTDHVDIGRSVRATDIKSVLFNLKEPWNRVSTFYINKDGKAKDKKAKMIIYALNEKGKDEKIAEAEFLISKNIGSGPYVETLKFEKI